MDPMENLRATMALRLLTIYFGWLLLGPHLFAETRCAVVLRVNDNEGQPITGHIVKVIDETGLVKSIYRLKNGRVDICDLGFGTFSLRIESCHPVTISGVREDLKETVNLFTTASRCISRDGYLIGCEVYLRVVGVHREPLEGVEAIFGEKPALLSDKYGRITTSAGFTYSPRSGKFESSVTSLSLKLQGYKPIQDTVTCNIGGRIERTIQMVPE